MYDIINFKYKLYLKFNILGNRYDFFRFVLSWANLWDTSYDFHLLCTFHTDEYKVKKLFIF